MSHGLGMMRKELFTKSYVPAERPGMPEDMVSEKQAETLEEIMLCLTYFIHPRLALFFT